MKTVICNKAVKNFTKGKSYQAKNYDYGVLSVKGDNGKYVVVLENIFSKEVASE